MSLYRHKYICQTQKEKRKKLKEQTNERLKEDFALRVPCDHPPTHSHLSGDDASSDPLPPRRPFSRSRTLPAQKQQITALQTTVQKAPQLTELKATADIISCHTDVGQSVIFWWNHKKAV